MKKLKVLLIDFHL